MPGVHSVEGVPVHAQLLHPLRHDVLADSDEDVVEHDQHVHRESGVEGLCSGVNSVFMRDIAIGVEVVVPVL